ncbi:MAG: hypothetical protein ACJARG_000683, partial [Arcticibacterium sp.]
MAVSYHEEVAVFIMTRGGLINQASVGGQHFKFDLR